MLRYKNSKLQSIIEIISVLLIVFQIVYLIAIWSKIPDKIPSHFNGAGEIDAYSGKSSIIMLICVEIFLYLSLSVVNLLPPSFWNLPVKLTEENVLRIIVIVKTMMNVLKLFLILIFAYMIFCSINSQPLGVWFLYASIISIFGTITASIILIIKKSKKA